MQGFNFKVYKNRDAVLSNITQALKIKVRISYIKFEDTALFAVM
jgi:hypothetical protein